MKSIFQNKLLTGVIIVLLLANLAVLVYYSFFREHSHKPKSPVTEFVKKDLAFDEAQMKSFEEIKKKNNEKRKQLYEEVAKSKDSLYQLVLVENLDDSLLFDRALAVADKVRILELEIFRQYKGIQGMCTPAQLAKFDAGFMVLARQLSRPMKSRDSSDKK